MRRMQRALNYCFYSETGPRLLEECFNICWKLDLLLTFVLFYHYIARFKHVCIYVYLFALVSFYG